MAESHELKRNIQTKLELSEYVCTVCVSAIHKTREIWSCNNCWTVFHLACIRQWSKNSLDNDSFWRCPVCNFSRLVIADKYTCFCGKFDSPDLNPFITPHSCGSVCDRKRPFCRHNCADLCHPGPCAPCPVGKVAARCGCGRNEILVECGSDPSKHATCGETCGKSLPCEKHFCEEKCHNAPCCDCKEKEENSCYCAKTTKPNFCAKQIPPFRCSEECGKPLNCQNHFCSRQCHPNGCFQCTRAPSDTETCACGKETAKGGARSSCTDPLGLCSAVCGKLLKCGTHFCAKKCHDSPCLKCKVKTRTACGCSAKTQTIACGKAKTVRCKKACRALKSCGRHFCGKLCCEGRMLQKHPDHLCAENCGGGLNCKIHFCDEKCHSNPCARCRVQLRSGKVCSCARTRVPGFLFCGDVVELKCPFLCQKPLPCGHACRRCCHYGDCAEQKCAALGRLMCQGGHVYKEAPCYETGVAFFCEEKCGGVYGCGIHKCGKKCHPGDCPFGLDHVCGLKRAECGHFCRSKCHLSKICDEMPCTVVMTKSCACGRRTVSVKCGNGSNLIPFAECDEACAAKDLAEKFRMAVGLSDETKTIDTLSNIWEDNEAVKKCENYKFAYFSRCFLEFCRKCPKSYVTKVEKKILDFTEDPAANSVHIKTPTRFKSVFVRRLAGCYNLNTEVLDFSKNTSVKITKETVPIGTIKYSFQSALEEYSVRYYALDELDLPENRVLRVNNFQKSKWIYESIQSLYDKELDDDYKIMVYRGQKIIFIICPNEEKMKECMAKISKISANQIKAFPAPIRDEVGVFDHIKNK